MKKILGLNEEEVLKLSQEYGQNIIDGKKEVSWPPILWSQFKSPLIYILFFVGIISLVLSEYIDASLAFIVVIVNVLMGFYQEYNAQKTLAALGKLIKPKTIVIREGLRKEIEVKELVPGDMVVVAAGDKVPADGKVISATNLLASEAILTGEEEALTKNGDNPVFMGTTVLAGKGIIEITAIGVKTEIGKISQSLLTIKEAKTPLQKRLEIFIKNLAWLVLVICAVIFLIGLFYQENGWEMFRMAMVLAVAAIPEGLPIAITVILALGMRKILKRHGLVKKLLSIETLGSTSVICTDKTGTLTEGVMRVAKTDFLDQNKALLALTLVNEQRSNLEVALWEYVKNSTNIDPQEIYDSYEKIEEEPFDSEKKYSLSVNLIEGKKTAFLIGAPEVVLSFCEIADYEKHQIPQNIENWANEGLRILGVAYKETGDLTEKKNFSWLGLVGIQDPIRKEVKEAIEIARRAGIVIKIVTGDYRRTAEHVARNLGFEISPENVLEGHELEIMSERELQERISKIILFTRVTPHQKLKIVNALQGRGEVVAMTGDGVNDAPALKKANVGVVVGGASEVAKEAGDLILLDSNFKTIVAACEEGRLIFANIKKVVGYVLSNAFAEIILILGAMIMDFPAPLTVVQILWIQLICDGPPDIILGFEPKEKTIMQESPHQLKREQLLTGPMKFLIMAISGTVGILSWLLFRYYFRETGEIELARTVAFATIASVSLIYIFSFKNLKKPIFLIENFFANKYLFVAIGYGFLLILVAIYVPFFNQILKTMPLGLVHWFLILGVGIITIVIVELVKVLTKKNK